MCNSAMDWPASPSKIVLTLLTYSCEFRITVYAIHKGKQSKLFIIPVEMCEYNVSYELKSIICIISIIICLGCLVTSLLHHSL
jgi:hypothetical protein